MLIVYYFYYLVYRIASTTLKFLFTMLKKYSHFSYFLFLMFFSFFLMAASVTVAQVKVENLLTENLINTIGLDVQQPRFTWQLESNKRNVAQTAYEIKVNGSSKTQDWVGFPEKFYPISLCRFLMKASLCKADKNIHG